MKNIIFFGPPGAGKGTFASLLKEKANLVHISTGEIFRNEIKNGSELGLKAKKYVESGELVPDSLVADMVSKRLSETDCLKGFILDGFPRTIPQAELLKLALDKNGMKIDAVISFEANDELLLQRLTARLICRSCSENFNKLFSPPKKNGICDKCGGELYQRADDSMETAKSRLDIYKKETAPLIEFYTNEKLLIPINSERGKEPVLKELLDIIKK